MMSESLIFAGYMAVMFAATALGYMIGGDVLGTIFGAASMFGVPILYSHLGE